MGEMQEKLQNWLTKDICLWYDDIVQALCERGPVFLLPTRSRGYLTNGVRGRSRLNRDRDEHWSEAVFVLKRISP